MLFANRQALRSLRHPREGLSDGCSAGCAYTDGVVKVVCSSTLE